MNSEDVRAIVRGEIMRALEIIREDADTYSRFGYALADAANAEIAERMEEAIRLLRGES